MVPWHMPQPMPAYIVMAFIVMAYIVMAYIIMAYIAMAYIIMAYIVMPQPMPARMFRHMSTHMKAFGIQTCSRRGYPMRSCV